MADEITLEIVTPDGPALSETVSEFTAPSVDGEFGVLPGHRPLLAALKTGVVKLGAGEDAIRVAVGPGFVEVFEDNATILTRSFCREGDVDPVRARLELKEVDERIDAFEGDPNSSEYVELVARELWAAVQLELYGDPPPPTVHTVYEMGGMSALLHDDEDED
jgi:F-type H+-transporting ATPase subunit epsilon